MTKVKIMTVVVFTIFAVGITGASCASAQWFVGGSELTASQLALLAELPRIDASPVLGFAGVYVLCGGVEFLKGRLFVPNEVFIKAIVFSKCHTIAPTPTACQLKGGNALLATGPVLGLANLINDTFKPGTGREFTSIPFEEGTSCVFSGEQPIKGAITIGTPDAPTESVGQAFEGQGSLENGNLEVGSGNKAVLLGKLLVLLENSSKWSFK